MSQGDVNPFEVGSSPLTRGKLRAILHVYSATRLIPAHAGKTSADHSPLFGCKAHPRSRGENADAGITQPRTAGSSPLTRGKRGRGHNKTPHRGLIPAHAGKTGSAKKCPLPGTAHPRSRGENRLIHWPTRTLVGSSPLTRGKLAAQAVDPLRRGLIPAHAGKTSMRRKSPHTTRAHPRSRGENVKHLNHAIVAEGSSPLTRGKPPHAAVRIGCERLIPAHAGKTVVAETIDVALRAHPRSRGENAMLTVTWLTLPGSSPLTRGKHGLVLRVRGHPGLIPAHAGKTRLRASWAWRTWAHPRSRGENKVEGLVGVADLGSSPLTRGKHAFTEQRPGGQRLIPAHAGKLTRRNGDVPGRGLIPAHAGKTQDRPRQPQAAPAHPRSRGENQADTLLTCTELGSSPLTRGKPYRGAALPARGVAHPRSRGENYAEVRESVSIEGSSPLTRGKLQQGGSSRRAQRLIPAHAGKTDRLRLQQFRARAHPRSRGENHLPTIRLGIPLGSSPLTRGKLMLTTYALPANRLIPAHAGKTTS